MVLRGLLMELRPGPGSAGAWSRFQFSGSWSARRSASPSSINPAIAGPAPSGLGPAPGLADRLPLARDRGHQPRSSAQPDRRRQGRLEPGDSRPGGGYGQPRDRARISALSGLFCRDHRRTGPHTRLLRHHTSTIPTPE